MSKTYVNRTYRYVHFAPATLPNTVPGPFRPRARQESSVLLLVGMSSLAAAVLGTLITVLLTVPADPPAVWADSAQCGAVAEVHAPPHPLGCRVWISRRSSRPMTSGGPFPTS